MFLCSCKNKYKKTVSKLHFVDRYPHSIRLQIIFLLDLWQCMKNAGLTTHQSINQEMSFSSAKALIILLSSIIESPG